jgi:hypothetical protein
MEKDVTQNNGQLLNCVCIRITLFAPVILLDMLHKILGENHLHLLVATTQATMGGTWD